MEEEVVRVGEILTSSQKRQNEEGLSYFAKSSDKRPKGSIHFGEFQGKIRVEKDLEDVRGFHLKVERRTYCLRAANEIDRNAWCSAIDRSIVRAPHWGKMMPKDVVEEVRVQWDHFRRF